MNDFLEYLREITNLQYTINLLSWELRINSPRNSWQDLIHLISYHEQKLFDLQTSDYYGQLLNDTINSPASKQLSEPEKRYLNILLRRYENNKKIPAYFYEEYSTMKKTANVVWVEAKETNNFSLFAPYLEKLIALTKRYYEYIEPDSENLYDVMLNKYEIGITSEMIDRLFGELKEGIINLIPKEDIEAKTINYNYTEEELITCAKYLLNYIGFDLNRGTVGIYPHGYTEKMNANDIRIAFKLTTNPINFVKTIIHEGGHGIFEQNIAPNLSKYENTTIDDLYALHESQSRFYENFLGRNKNFWLPIYDDIKKLLHLDIDIDEFVSLLNTPRCGLIRTEADELTYCMHIILRYEIERDIFSGKLAVEGIPEIWNQKMLEYLNITVPNYSKGVLQDVHWSQGEFGYFPSYLLGSIYDGMFLESIENNLGSIDELLRNGQINKITEYLKENIYTYGGAYTSLEVISRICNKELTVQPLIDYFNNKYGQKKTRTK